MSGRRVARVRVWRVRIPLRMAYVGARHIQRETFRTVIQVETADGAVGLGEAPGHPEVLRLAAGLAGDLLGHDPIDRRGFERRFAPSVFDNRNGRNGWSSHGGLELALWDLVGRLEGLPFATLLGGPPTRPIDLVCPVPALVADEPLSRADLVARLASVDAADQVVDYAMDHAQRLGFRSFKYESAAVGADFDIAVMRALRKALPDAHLRFDANAGYPPAEAIALCRALERLHLELLEDPTDDQEGLARLRAEVETPVATRRAVTQLDQLAAAIRRKPVDVVLADLSGWGGPLRFRALVHTAAATGFEVAIHGRFETGIGTAASLHLAAALGEIKRPTETGHHLLGDDVIRPDVLTIRNGAMTVPEGAGLGVELDPDHLRDLTIEEHEVRK